MPTALVTGCAGFIGSHLSEALLARGIGVRGIDCLSDYYARERKEENLRPLLDDPQFDFHRLDLAQAELEPLLDGVDGIYHLAGQPGVRAWGEAFELYVRRNLLASQRLFEVAAGRGLRVVFASSSSVYGDAERYPTGEDAPPQPLSPYGVSKLACERLAYAYGRNFGLDTVTLRYFTVYGPRQRPDMAFARLTQALLGGESFPIFGDGEQSREFTYVEDAVAATTAAMERAPAGAVYNVSGGSEATLLEAIRICERLAGRSLATRLEPPAAGDARRTKADTSRISSDLGWSPSVGLEQGLAAQLAWAGGRVFAR